MKQLFSLFILLLASLRVLAADATSGSCGDNVTWTITGDVLTLSGTGATNSYASASKSPWSYQQAQSINKIIIPEGITSIGSNLFCSFNITEINLPESLTSIEKYAFNSCKNLNNVTIPKNVNKIGDLPFNNCDNLISITVNDATPEFTVRSSYATFGFSKKEKGIAPYMTFLYKGNPQILVNGKLHANFTTTYSGTVTISCATMDDLADIWKPETINQGDSGDIHWTLTDDNVLILTGDGAMPDYLPAKAPWHEAISKQYTYIYFKGRLTNIGANAFTVGQITNINEIPATVTSIGENAFANANLNYPTMPAALKSIGKKAFRSSTIHEFKSSLSDNATPLEYIGDSAFFGSSIYTIVNLLTPGCTIGYNAFGDFRSSNLTIPSSAIGLHLSGNFLSFSDALAEMKFPAAIAPFGFSNRDFHVAIDTTARGIAISATAIKNNPQTIPTVNGKALNDTIFISNPSATIKVAFADRYASGSCGESATWQYDKLTRIITIKGTGAIDRYETDQSDIFSTKTNTPWTDYTNDIDSVVVCEGITNLGYYAFFYCKNLRGADIASTVKTYGQSTFAYCPLQNVRVRGTYVNQVAEPCFHNYDSCTLYVPVKKLDMYKKTEVFKEFARIIGVCDVTTYKGDYGKVRTSVSEVLQGDSVTFTATPDKDNYRVSKILINSSDATDNADLTILSTNEKTGAVTYVLHNVSTDVELEARFEKKETAITTPTADHPDRRAPRYNLRGQRVTESYKGIVIQGRRKLLQH